MQLTILVEPTINPRLPFSKGAERYRQFAEELERVAHAKVDLINGSLDKAPQAGFILLAHNGDPARCLESKTSVERREIAERIILLDVSWQQALKQLETYRFAGAVDSLQLREWETNPARTVGPFGLKDLADPLGAECVPLPMYRSKHYCLFKRDSHRGMPQLLVNYLQVYQQDFDPLGDIKVLPIASSRAAFLSTTDVGSESKTWSFVNLETVVRLLKKEREKRKLSIDEIAAIAGIDPAHILDLEKRLIAYRLGEL